MNKARSSTRDDFDKIKDALQKLKSENRKLRKEISSLRKELNRIPIPEVEPEDPVFETEVLVESIKSCPKCNSEGITEIRAGRYTIQHCSCGFKKRVDSLKKTV